MNKHNLNPAIITSLPAGRKILKICDFSENCVAGKSDNMLLIKANITASTWANCVLIKSRIPGLSKELYETVYILRKNWNLCWIADSLKSIKDFIRKNGDFKVNIAFCAVDSLIFGEIYAPDSMEM